MPSAAQSVEASSSSACDGERRRGAADDAHARALAQVAAGRLGHARQERDLLVVLDLVLDVLARVSKHDGELFERASLGGKVVGGDERPDDARRRRRVEDRRRLAQVGGNGLAALAGTEVEDRRRRAGVEEVRHALREHAVVLGRGAAEHDLARALRDGALDELARDARDARLAVDLRPGLAERLERLAPAEAHADDLEQLHGGVDDLPALLR